MNAVFSIQLSYLWSEVVQLGLEVSKGGLQLILLLDQQAASLCTEIPLHSLLTHIIPH